MGDAIRMLLAGGAAALACGPTWAAGPAASLEQLLQVEVEGASRFAQPLAEAPAAVSVLSADDIRQFGFRTLGEALSSMRGVYTSNERDYTYLGIRGFGRPGDYNTRMLLLTDGIRRNDPLYDSAAIGREAPVEIGWVKRLEFVPGPASALYGQNALFGVANAVMWSGADIEGTRVSADLGSGNLAHAGLLAGRALERGGDWLIGLSAYGRRGEDLDIAGLGRAQGRDGERTLKAIVKANVGNWQADAGYSTRRKDIPTGYWGTLFNAPGTYIVDDWAYADASHIAALAPSLTGQLRLRAGAYRYAGQYASAGLDSRDEAGATWYGADYLLTFTGWRDHKLLLGADLQRNRVEQRYLDVAPRAEFFDDRRRSSSAGVFVQDEWRIGPAWMANLGLRADRIAGYSAASPRAALIHRLAPAATVKLIYGRSFRPPNAYERYYSDGDTNPGQTTKANPEAGLERLTMQEVVLDVAPHAALRLSGSYYHYRIDGLLDQVTDPADGLLVFVNRPSMHAHGVEAEVEALLGAGFRLRGSLARQHVSQSFGTVPNSPRLLGKLLLDGPLFDSGWTLGLNVQGLDARHTVVDRVAGHVAANLLLRRNGGRAEGDWSVGVYNLSGQRYLDPASAAVASGAVAQDGRQFRLGWEIAY